MVSGAHWVDEVWIAEVQIGSEQAISPAVDEVEVSKEFSLIYRGVKRDLYKCHVKLLMALYLTELIKMNKTIKDKKVINFTPSPLVWGQSLQELQVTHKISLPVSICTLNSVGGEPNFTFVK